jgi:hypothetical protein
MHAEQEAQDHMDFFQQVKLLLSLIWDGIVVIVETKHTMLEGKHPMHGVYTICMEMCGSGV